MEQPTVRSLTCVIGLWLKQKLNMMSESFEVLHFDFQEYFYGRDLTTARIVLHRCFAVAF